MLIRGRIGDNTERKETSATKEEGAEAGAFAKKTKGVKCYKT